MISCYADAASLAAFIEGMGDNSPSLTEAKRAQVYFLYHIAAIARREIARITGYAPSTLSSMRNNVADYAELAALLFEDTRSEETEAPIAAAMCRRCGDCVIPIDVLAGAGIDTDRTNKVYLFKFYGADKTTPIFSKIGTTTRTCVKRLREEINDYRNAGFPVEYAAISRIIDVGDIPPEIVESFIRCMLMKVYTKDKYRPLDRYSDDIPVKLFDKLYRQFLSIEVE